MKKRKKKGRIGSSFDDYLKDDGLYEEATARALKRVIARRRAQPHLPGPYTPNGGEEPER
jgi:hypothetical protein